jgi:hypothetical protein
MSLLLLCLALCGAEATASIQYINASECKNDFVIGIMNVKVDGKSLPLYVIQQSGVDGNVTVDGDGITMTRTSSAGGPRVYLAKECAAKFGPDIYWQAKYVNLTPHPWVRSRIFHPALPFIHLPMPTGCLARRFRTLWI